MATWKDNSEKRLECAGKGLVVLLEQYDAEVPALARKNSDLEIQVTKLKRRIHTLERDAIQGSDGRLECAEKELATLKEQYTTEVPALELKNADLENQVTELKQKIQKIERDARKLERDAKIDGPIMASWKDNVSENLATLNSKQSTAEWEAVYSKRMSSMYQENQMKMAKLEARMEQMHEMLLTKS
jgi:chromosome segregation ATPase